MSMAKQMEYISDIRMPDMLHGTLLRATIPQGKLVSLGIPELPEDVYVITKEDIPGSAMVSVLGSELPLFAEEEISYQGEPIAAVFAPTLEAAQVWAASMSINYEAGASIYEVSPIHREYHDSRGSCEEFFTPEAKVIDQVCLSKEHQSSYTAPNGAVCEISEGTVNIRASTLWPHHVQAAVSQVCAVKQDHIRVRQTASSPYLGEKLIYPSLYSCCAALAAMKSGRPARIIDDFPAWSPRITIKRKTALTDSGDLLAESIDITADLGAYPLFAEEIIEHLRTGAMGYAPAEAYQIRVRIITSAHPPRYYFNGFGYDAALFSAELHASSICSALQINPAHWRLNRLLDKKVILLNGAPVPSPLFEDLLTTVINASAFNRKHAVFTANQGQRRRQQLMSGYLRGIGLASGFTPNGFSNGFDEENHYSVTVTLGDKDSLSIYTSLHTSEAASAWKTIAREVLNIPEGTIHVVPGDTETLPDSGPHILSRDIAVIAPAIRSCCESIKQLRFKEPLPISVTRACRREKSDDQQTNRLMPFSTVCWGAMVVELEIDTISFMPVIRGIWCTLDCGPVYNEHRLRSTLLSKLLKAIQLSVEERILPEYIPIVDMRFLPGGIDEPVSGVQTLLGLFHAAFCSALSQAIDRPIAEIPIAPPEILSLLEDTWT